jgi:ATP-dependent helicase HrpB
MGDADRLLLMQQICLGCFSSRDIVNRPVWPVLNAWVTPGQKDLIDQHAPDRLQLPSGHRARIRYAEDTPPTLSARIQDLYGLQETPSIAMGQQPLLIEILAPNQRPVQVTTDLASFWDTTYPELKPQLQKRYPKHEWR